MAPRKRLMRNVAAVPLLVGVLAEHRHGRSASAQDLSRHGQNRWRVGQSHSVGEMPLSRSGWRLFEMLVARDEPAWRARQTGREK